MARTMLTENDMGNKFWREAVHTTIYVQNRCMLRPHRDKTPYELWFDKKVTAKHFKVFGSKCYMKNTSHDLGKFDDRADEGIFLGYSTSSKSYKCYNKRHGKIIESADVRVDEHKNSPTWSNNAVPIFEDLDSEQNDNETEKEQDVTNVPRQRAVVETEEREEQSDSEADKQNGSGSSRVRKNHPEKLILGDPSAGM
ncbi:hypothetical protein NE237_022717 [Protea cynaroides]|uniref:Retroviral polymerase SH3-like domain-containing protein n=1 Tax=Protea cynaroides TaxID=273540 RepID=A0A9Q0K627_9MAGN|nr:hypothetical protein NE237_022717 [Protea cynaroides]